VKYLSEFRDPQLAGSLVQRIRQQATRRWVVMEVCGGQTHSLLRHGITEALEGSVEFIHGPGCPVCVTPAESIDRAIQLAARPDVILASFGDMLRVPGSSGSLLEARRAGGDVRVVYSPLDAVQLARAEPQRQVVFFAVGFETTVPATALAVLQAEREGLQNFSLLTAHVRVAPAMEMILSADEHRVDAFLAAGHVCTVTGVAELQQLVADYGIPIVVTGFEPVDLLLGIHECVELLERGTPRVVNQYARTVDDTGNRSAQTVVQRVYGVADQPWRGLGTIPAGGLRLRSEYAAFDAVLRFGSDETPQTADCSECRSGDVLCGRIKPHECPAFATKCTPQHPLGAPMVSAEGACAAYYRYRVPQIGTVADTVSNIPISG
jgi:hydrogenase expression/formation protein HypD